MRPPQIGRRQILAVAGISVSGALAACSGQGTGTQHLRLSSWNIPTDLESYQAIADRFVGQGPAVYGVPHHIMIPIQVTLVPSFLVVARLGLVDSPWAVILPTAFDVVGIFIARQFMLAVPNALVEAARVDGAGEFRAFFSVVLPTCGPLIGVLVILAFMARWNEFLWPMVVLQSNESLAVPVALSTLTNNPAFASPWGAVMAVATVTVLPILVVFLAFQRQFVQGISSTGIK